MSIISFIDNNNLANSFIQELYIGFNWDPQSVAVTLSTARYGNANQNFSITISINGGANLSDAFTFEQEYSGNVPPNPIKLESNGIYKGVDCYAVVCWNAISDPSLADVNGIVNFAATINKDVVIVLDNSQTIKQFIYDHALEGFSWETNQHPKFVKEGIYYPELSGINGIANDCTSFVNAINNPNYKLIKLTNDIAISTNSLTSDVNFINPLEHVNTLINFRNKNLVINGNGHKVYEKGTFLQVTLSQDGSRHEAPFSGNLEGNDAFITANGTIIPLTKSKMYKGRGWQVIGYESADDDDEIDVGIQLPEITTNNNYELNHLSDYGECNNLFVSYRLSYLRYTKRVEYISNGYLFFKVKNIDYDDNKAIRDISSHPDFFLINYSGDTDDVGALVKGGYVSYPSFYGNQVSKCWASYLFRVKENSNIVFNKVTFIGGLDYSVRNDGTLHLNKCHFTNQVGGGVVNYRRMLVDRCTFTDIFSYGVRFEHVVGISSPYPYLEVTNSTFRNIAHYGTNTSAIRSIGKAYIAGNEFINTNYSAIYTGQANCSSLDELHSHNLIERNFIHYTPEWIEKRKTFGLQDSGDIYVSVNNIMAVVRLNTIVGTGGIGGTSKYRKNNAIYVDDGAYNVKIYGNVIMGTENFYDIDSRDVSNNEGYNRQTPNNHDNNGAVLNLNYTNKIDPNNDPNNAYIDLSQNNLIAFNVCDGWVRMQENLTLNETGCEFFSNFILENFRSIKPDNMTNIYNWVNDCLHSKGIMPDEFGMNSCSSLWHLMYMNKKKLL